ncbi:MAG: hypothetical protein ABIH28_03160 [archaeon]
MELKKIKIFPSKDLSQKEVEYLFEVLEGFPLKGEANYETEMDAHISNISNESIGEKITLSPRVLESRLKFSFELDPFPKNYSREYLFGGSNVSPFLIITELSPADKRFPVKRRYKIYSAPIKEED